MRRLTIMLAAAAALLLVPAASAFAAAGTVTAEIEGIAGGSGEVTSVGGFEGGGVFEGSPPMKCSGPPATDPTCSTKMEQIEELELEGLYMYAVPAPGSKLVEFKSVEGEVGCPWTEGNDCMVMQGFESGANAKVLAVFESLGPELTVVKEGTGDGTVVSSPAGIECGATCSANFSENSIVTLTASPDSESLFVSWKKCDAKVEYEPGKFTGVEGRKCTVKMSAAKTVGAKFIKAYDVTVNRVGSGLGKVSSLPGGVLCLSNCSTTTAAFKEGTSVTLNAVPSKNFVFTEWTGDCTGSGSCALGALGADKTVGAKFTEVAKHLLTVNKSGGGQGTAKSNLAGINCGATCSTMSAAYYQGAVVELTATPGKGSSFGGWSGSGCSGTGTCTVTMSAAKSVTAEFK